MHRRGQTLLRYLYPTKTKRGRPGKYNDEIILTLLFLQVAWRLSFRELEFMSVQVFGREITIDFSTYYCRLKRLPPYLLINFLDFISRRLLRRYHREVKFLIIDETGFKYDELYPLKILRIEIKRVRSHVKTVVLSVHLENGKRFVLPERIYASEVKYGKKIIRWLGCRGFILNVLRGKPLLGDKAYDSVKFIELLENIGFEPYIKVKETFRKSIRSEVRLRAKKLIESNNLYRFRRLCNSS